MLVQGSGGHPQCNICYRTHSSLVYCTWCLITCALLMVLITGIILHFLLLLYHCQTGFASSAPVEEKQEGRGEGGKGGCMGTTDVSTLCTKAHTALCRGCAKLHFSLS